MVIPFFETGIAPIELMESLGVTAFLEAASRSKGNGGKSIKTEC